MANYIATAISALATFAGTIPGIRHSYDISATPEQLTTAQLPACVIIFDQPLNVQTRAMQGNQIQYNFSVVQLCLITPGDIQQYRRGMSQVIPFLDAFLDAYRVTPYLAALLPGISPAIHAPTSPKVTAGAYEYGDKHYYGIEFVVPMMINL